MSDGNSDGDKCSRCSAKIEKSVTGVGCCVKCASQGYRPPSVSKNRSLSSSDNASHFGSADIDNSNYNNDPSCSINSLAVQDNHVSHPLDSTRFALEDTDIPSGTSSTRRLQEQIRMLRTDDDIAVCRQFADENSGSSEWNTSHSKTLSLTQAASMSQESVTRQRNISKTSHADATDSDILYYEDYDDETMERFSILTREKMKHRPAPEHKLRRRLCCCLLLLCLLLLLIVILLAIILKMSANSGFNQILQKFGARFEWTLRHIGSLPPT